jgi:hypothetical protein
VAEEYARRYTGEFEPLLDAQQVLRDGETLPVVLVRKVLNSMRHDRNWYSRMPVPSRDADILPMRPPKQPKAKKYKTQEKQCPETEGHREHPWDKRTKPDRPEWDYYWTYRCKGVPFKITRKQFTGEANVKYPLAAAPTGSLIHSVNPDGPHWTSWQGPLHAWGWKSDEMPWTKADADLNVKLRCKFPSWLRNPILLRPEQVVSYLAAQASIGRTGFKRCPHCIKIEESL